MTQELQGKDFITMSEALLPFYDGKLQHKKMIAFAMLRFVYECCEPDTTMEQFNVLENDPEGFVEGLTCGRKELNEKQITSEKLHVLCSMWAVALGIDDEGNGRKFCIPEAGKLADEMIATGKEIGVDAMIDAHIAGVDMHDIMA